MAMWQLYGQSTNSIAITTTVGKIEKQLEQHNLHKNIHLKRVEYINHFEDPRIDVTKYTNIFIYKHEAYTYEQEARIIVDHYPNPEVMGIESPGLSLKVKPSGLLRSIVVSPGAPDWFYKLIFDLSANYNCRHLVSRSELSKEPI